MRNAQGKTRKVLATTLVLGLLAGLATIASFAAFSSTTSNGANDFDSGTVHIVDNDGGTSVMWDVDNQKPGQTTVKCIDITYMGSLAASVKLYGSRATTETLDQYVDLTVEEGTQATPAFGDCTGFSSTNVLYDGTLQGFMTSHSDWTNGKDTTDANGATWANSDHRVYRFTIEVQDNNNANGGASALSTGNHTFTWEARNN